MTRTRRAGAGLVSLIVALAACTSAHAATRALSADVAAPVRSAQAALLGEVDPSTPIDVNVGLPLRNQAQMDAAIAQQSDPSSPEYGHPPSFAQVVDAYAPTQDQVDQTLAWLRAQQLAVVGVSSDRTSIKVHDSVGAIERAFNVDERRYSLDGQTYRANTGPPTVPDTVNWVGGLDDLPAVQTELVGGGFEGTDFRNGFYNVTGDGHGQTLGFVVYGAPIAQDNYDKYAADTNTTPLKIGQAGDDGLTWKVIGTQAPAGLSETEIALDTQVAHAVAPGIHETYFLAHDNQPVSFEDTFHAAAASGIKIFSDSIKCDICDTDPMIKADLALAGAAGTTFFFGTGDAGASESDADRPVSEWQFEVGGTQRDGSTANPWDEMAWPNGGGGCSDAEPPPSWQTGIGSTFKFTDPSDPSTIKQCGGRAIPDVSAIATAAYVVHHDNNGNPVGKPVSGTSLSTPLWAAMAIVWRNNNQAAGRPVFGYLAPLIYQLANNPTTYADDFHDITSGNNGFAARPGWDEATGWGTPRFQNLTNHPVTLTYTGPQTVTVGDQVTLSGTLTINGTAPLPWKKPVTLGLDGQTCTDTADDAGNVSCKVTVPADAGAQHATLDYAGDVSFAAGHKQFPVTINGLASKLVYTGPDSGINGTQATLSAALTDPADGHALDGRRVTFTLGSQACNATTDTNGNATCAISLTDPPNAYTVLVDFAGGNRYAAAHTEFHFGLIATPVVTNAPATKITAVKPIRGVYHHAVTTSATLSTAFGAPLAGQPVDLVLASDTCRATTNASGVASCQLTPTQPTGAYSLRAVFAGTTAYRGSSAGARFTLKRQKTTLTVTAPNRVVSYQPATLTATLKDDRGAGVAGARIKLGLRSPDKLQTCHGTTSSTGSVHCTIASVTKRTNQTSVQVGATFARTKYLLGASITKSICYRTGPFRSDHRPGSPAPGSCG